MNNLSQRLAEMSPKRRQYTLDTLANHLHSAGQNDRLATLFDSDIWMQARFEGSGYTYSGFLADLDIAWGVLLTQEETDRVTGMPMATLAQQMRYGLLESSINSLSANVSPALVARLVRSGPLDSRASIDHNCH